ncbi:FAD-dependent oxidoreductase [Aquimarina sp. ERC-38]|uniref:flavin-containing monooxygenase n=1 Tax=Aquimarina sp. ERC-38 TaxID=2949996 RepID=UPI002246CFE9|nr:FAD-dependent oxidoreductase [Aquimarina sp. ERC-38]UZO79168.1 FAD-dependent oxidoreductase [Aquimarina sp. ERC-38]
MKKKVCVIGAGPSGLVTIKELIANDIDVTCYEIQDEIGGAFRSIQDGGRSYDSLELTVSNYFMAYSDFMPNTNEERKYWKVHEYREYLDAYVKKHKLKNYILFSHEIISAHIRNSKIEVKGTHAKEEFSEIFDHMIICTGSNFTPKSPDFDGQDLFEGKIIHSSAYNNNQAYKGKKVVCVGLGESGADVVHEIGQVTSCKVLVSEYPNIIARWINGYTNDAFTSYCFYAMKKKGIDTYMRLKAKFYLKYGKKVKDSDRLIQEWTLNRESFMGKFFTKNDIFIQDILDGKVEMIKDSIKSLTKNGIITQSGKKISSDVILCNTGYQTCFKKYAFGDYFVDPRSLYKQMIHSELGTLVSVVGWARPSQGGLPACSEMQARYIALLIAGKKELPIKKQIEEEIKVDRTYYDDMFYHSKKIRSLVSYHDFMITMAELIGCKPKLWYWSDMNLTLKMFFGSHLPYFYRLKQSEQKANSIKLIKSLPIAYSFRRLLIVLLFICLYNPLFWLIGYKTTSSSRMDKRKTIKGKLWKLARS